MRSHIEKTNKVPFPGWNAERHYMVPFLQKEGLSTHLKHWQPTVDAMLDGITTNKPIYLMVDQKLVKKGEPHRRPGLHVDGYWMPSIQAHGPRHGPLPSPGHGPGHGCHGGTELLLLASDIPAACGYIGEYHREFIKDWRGGDCSDVDPHSLMPVYMEADVCYKGDVFTIHESLPVKGDCWRTLVRLNVPM